MKTSYIIGGALVALFAFVFLFNGVPRVSPAKTTNTDAKPQEVESREEAPVTQVIPVKRADVVTPPTQVVTPTPTSTNDVVVTTNTPEVPVATAGALREYTSSSDLANLTGTNILFFKAPWCVTCTELYKSLVAEQANIPEDVTIWVVDYDSNKEMRVQYGVTTQHTLVQIDTQRNKVNSWRGTFTLAEVLSNIK